VRALGAGCPTPYRLLPAATLAIRDLYVDVMWPDGTPAVDGARAFAEIGRARAAFEHSPKESNRVTMRQSEAITPTLNVKFNGGY
jgi:hypothetical protein